MLISEVLKTNKSGTKSTVDKMELYIPILCKCSGEIMSHIQSHIKADREEHKDLGQEVRTNMGKPIGAPPARIQPPVMQL